jgi:hypothetical protein
MKKTQIQQGDVLFRKVYKMPAGVRPVVRTGGVLVIAEGEATGHHHVIAANGASMLVLEKNGRNDFYLEVTEPVTITHDEHKPLTIPTGVYKIGRVKEYDYFAEMERRVVD